MADPKFNLLILHSPGGQLLSDWITVKRRIDEKAPDIETRITSPQAPDLDVLNWLETRPALVFAAFQIPAIKTRARFYACRGISKLDQAAILSAASLPHPGTLKLFPGLMLDLAKWGEYVIVKPDAGQVGSGVRLVKTRDLASLYSVLMNTGGVAGDRLVQQFIDHTDEAGYLVDYRCLMLFGTPLYLHRRKGKRRRRPLDLIAKEQSPEIASNRPGTSRNRECVYDAEVIELAKRACSAIPTHHLVALDIGRDRATGNLVIFEMNTGGNWHLSSAHARHEFPPRLINETYRQFNALERTADLLIEKVRTEAT